MGRTAGTFCKDEVEVIMSQKNWYLVAYDVRDERRLQKVGKLMVGYGTRIQYSIFRCRLSERNLEKLRWEIVKIMKEEDDLFILQLCPSCVKRLREKFGEKEWPIKIPSFEIV